MKQKRIPGMMRFAGCAALLALLAASSYAARKPVEIPAAAVLIAPASQAVQTDASMTQTSEKLKNKRQEALALLESILSDPDADQAVRSQAQKEKLQIVRRMDTEASVEELLAHMGFGQTQVIMGEGILHIISPWQTAENAQNRVKMIDAAVSQSGLSADAVKIILAKNE